jgi:hypothetical protein
VLELAFLFFLTFLFLSSRKTSRVLELPITANRAVCGQGIAAALYRVGEKGKVLPKLASAAPLSPQRNYLMNLGHQTPHHV